MARLWHCLILALACVGAGVVGQCLHGAGMRLAASWGGAQGTCTAFVGTRTVGCARPLYGAE